ncbi:MAG: ABC transporter permease [Olsenella sp.]|nr:ABC transporter permease [Olsenella sp.]
MSNDSEKLLTVSSLADNEFSKDKMYGHVAIAYVSTDTYEDMMSEVNPMYQDTVHAVAVQGAAGKQIDGTTAYTKAEVVQAIPGYQAEQMAITMVEWLLVVITAVIIGIFFFVINLQKEKEFGVMKAIGTSTARLTRFIICQVFLIAASGAVVACALVALMSSFLPASMPFYLVWGDVATALVAFVLISILSSLASVARVARIDPAKIIGGDFQ